MINVGTNHVNCHVVTELSQPAVAKYLVIITDRGITSEVRHFVSLEEAKRAFEETARDYGYEPEDVNGSDYCDVSIWKWTENGYEKVFLYE